MKRLKVVVIALCASVFFACLGVFAACGGDNPPATDYYTVTTDYDATKGTVTVTPPADVQGYIKDESVTVTVTANTDYEADTVKVNGSAVTLEAGGKYTFRIAGNTSITATFRYIGWKGATWTSELGTLAFGADNSMTLTPEGGEATPVIVTTPGVDLSEGFPEGEIDVTVGGKAYKVSFGTFITFMDGYTPYVFDSEPITDFSAYEGTWKQYNSANEMTVAATGITYGGNTYAEYYTAFDGSHYLKYQMTALTKPQRYLFGYLGSAENVIYLNYGASVYHFTKDGELPTAAFPTEFYGEWWNETYFTLSITAAGAIINEDGAVAAFAVTGAGENAVVHTYYNNLYCTIRLQKNATTSATEIVLNNGSTDNVFTAVEPEALPADYRGDWTELEGENTLAVDASGNLTYEGKTRETTRDSHDFGFHFYTDAGKKATLMYFEHSGVLALDNGNGAITYYAKTPLSELADIAASSVPAGTWTAEGKTLTVNEEKKITLTEGGDPGETAPVRLVFAEIISSEEVGGNVQHYNGEAIYGGIYWQFDYNLETQAITLTRFTDLAAQTTETITFAKDTQGGGGSDPTVTIPEGYADVKGTWSEVTVEGSPRTLTVSAAGNIKIDGTDVTATADFSNEEFKLTVGGTQYTVMFAPEVGDNVEHGALVFMPNGAGDYIYFRNTAVTSKEIGAAGLASTRWTATGGDMSGMSITITAEGALDFGGDTAFILSYAMESGTPKWTMFLNGMFVVASVSGNKLSLYDLENFQGGTAMLEFDRQTVGVTFPANMRGEWVCTTFSAPEHVGGSSAIDKEVSFEIATDTAKWGSLDLDTVTDAGEGKYSFTTTAPIDGDEETTYTFWLQADNILLLDDGTQTYALFKADWAENNLEIAVKAPDAYGTGEWTGANGEKLQITVPGDDEPGHEVYLTISAKKLSGDPIWLLSGPTATLAKGYIKPVGPSHYVYAEMSLSEETITVKLFFKFSAPDVYTFTKKAAEETYETPFAMRDKWVLFTGGALDSSHTIEVTKNSIKFDGAAVTGVSVDENEVVTFTANGKTYTAQTVADDYALRLKAEEDGTYSIYVSSLLDESEKAYTTFTGTWTCEQGVGDLVFAADGSATLNGKAVFGVASGHIGVTYFTFVADGMVYKATLSGSTITLTDLDNHTYTYTKQA